jgi:hypothetical protein
LGHLDRIWHDFDFEKRSEGAPEEKPGHFLWDLAREQQVHKSPQ